MVFIRILLLCLFGINSATAIRCLSCQGVVDPAFCTTVRTCSYENKCGLKKYVTVNGETRYDLDCVHDTSCNYTGAGGAVRRNIFHGVQQRNQCNYCCDGDMCNVRGCGADGYPSKRGLVCFNCDQTTSPETCEHLSFCWEDEMCAVYKEAIFDRVFFSSRCAPKHTCVLPLSSPIIGKRQSAEHRCGECCGTDYCNTHCGSAELPRSSTTMSTTTTTTATTTTPTTTTTTTTTTIPPVLRNCQDVQIYIGNISGVYNLRLSADLTVDVWCDMKTEGGGWTVIEKRFNGSVDFSRTWNEYKHGFGSAAGEYWLGNDAIHLLTTQGTVTARIDMEDWHGHQRYAELTNFQVMAETDKYRMTYFNISGTAGDLVGFSLYNGKDFTTKDHDHDTYGGNCAVLFNGGWWYGACIDVSNLNGLYRQESGGSDSKAMSWYNFVSTASGYKAEYYLVHFSAYNGKDFTTKDRDYDTYGPENCAVLYNGGWWYGSCIDASNLNGLYRPESGGSDSKAMSWYNFVPAASGYKSLKSLSLMVHFEK